MNKLIFSALTVLLLSTNLNQALAGSIPSIRLNAPQISISDLKEFIVLRDEATPPVVILESRQTYEFDTCVEKGVGSEYGQDKSCGYETIQHGCSISEREKCERDRQSGMPGGMNSCEERCQEYTTLEMKYCQHEAVVCTKSSTTTNNALKKITLDFSKLKAKWIAGGIVESYRINVSQYLGEKEGNKPRYTPNRTVLKVETLSAAKKINTEISSDNQGNASAVFKRRGFLGL